MIKDAPLPTEAEEYRNTAEILRDLAAQMRFGNTRNKLVTLAENPIYWLPMPSVVPRLLVTRLRGRLAS